jgi:HlyD family secretion protein
MPANVINLADCSQFRQTLAARPPRIVHGAVMLLIALLAAAVIWAALVKANLVVRAPGRVRPQEIPTRVFNSASADLEGRVIEAPFSEGDVVRQGDVLVRRDTAHIDNRISKVERTLESANDEIEKLSAMEKLLDAQLGVASQKAQAELAQAEAAVVLAAGRRESEIRKAQADLTAAKDVYERYRKLATSRVVSQQDLMKAESEYRQAHERLVQAQLPVEDAPVAVARRAVELVASDFAVRRSELEARKLVKEGEVEAARKDLANLNMQRQESVLRSPIDGVVVGGHIRAGDVLEPGKAVLEIARQKSFMFETLVSSEDVGNLRVGMPVQIKFDAYDYQKYGVLKGEVTYISPDSKVPESPEAKAPAARTSPAAYVVRVKLHAEELGRGELRGKVKLGLGGTAEIVTDQESLLKILFKKIRQTVSLG